MDDINKNQKEEQEKASIDQQSTSGFFTGDTVNTTPTYESLESQPQINMQTEFIRNEPPNAIDTGEVAVNKDSSFQFVGNDVKQEGGNETPVVLQSSPPLPRKKPPLIMLIGMVLVVLVLVGGVLFLSGKLGKKTSETKKITWWNLWEDDAVLRSLIQEYETKNPGVKIEYLKQSPQDYRERLVNSLARGAGPDIFVFHNTWAPLLARDLDRVPSSVLGPADFARDYYYVISSDLTIGSGLVGIPLGYDALTLFINEDLFKEANVEPPTTWVELRERAKVLTKVENGKIIQSGVALGRTENVDHWQEIIGLMLLQNGVNLSNPEPDLVENTLYFFTLFSKVDKVWDETLPSSTAAFAGGS